MKNIPSEGAFAQEPDFEDQKVTWVPKSSFDGPLRTALAKALPPGGSFGFNIEGDRAWICVSKPGDVHRVLQAALAELGRA